MNVLEMKCLKMKLGNEEVHRRAGIERVVRSFGHVEIMDEYCVKNVVKVAFCNRGVTVEAVRQYTKDRKEWRALVYM